MNDLIAWLRACLDDDERVAREAGPGISGRWSAELGFGQAIVENGQGEPVVYDEGSPSNVQATHIARWDPARVLAEVDAKRRILDEHHPIDPCDAHDAAFRTIPCDTMRLLALPYAEREGYLDEWRP